MFSFVFILPEDGDLSLKHVGGLMFMDNLYFITICVQILVYKNEYKQNARNE
jgi:hypothetical protein